MTAKRQLRGLRSFDHIDFAQAPCPAVLLAITGAAAGDVLPAAQDAIKKVRGLDTETTDIRNLTILEMDYAFTNLGFFMSCVGDYRNKSLTLEDWSKRPRSEGIFYAVETRASDEAGKTQSHVVAVLGGQMVCCRNRDVIEVSSASIARHLVGQVFAITPMADARWSA
jgi:hypothetical protein